MSQITALMKWYGQCAIGKVDIKAALDGFQWQHLLNTLLKRGVPEGLACMTGEPPETRQHKAPDNES
eukprot:2506912-Amphidinium_carterae.2